MLLFFDIDGTLIGEENHKMPESTRYAIEQARKNGHICVINTGRTLKMVGEDITGLTKFDGLLMGCGTMIVYQGKTLLHSTFTEKEALEIMDGLQRHRIDAILEGCENNYMADREKMFSPEFAAFSKNFENLHYAGYAEAAGNFDKFYSYVEDVSNMEAFQREFADRLDFIDRKGGFFEVVPKGHSKASAMSCLAEALNIPMTETAAFGDSSNDIPMIQCAKYGIAMGNASKEVKEIADYVTTDIEQDGILNALKWLGCLGTEE